MFSDGIKNGDAYSVTVKTQPSSPSQVCCSEGGRFAYAADGSSNDVSAYAVDAASGALTPVAHAPFAAGNEPRAIVID